MQIGNLDRRITVQTSTTSTDAVGQPIETWATYRKAWAMLTYDRGDEYFEADQKTAVRIVKFIIRYDSGVTEKMRICYGSGLYDIRAIEEIGRQKYLVLKTEKRD